MRSMRIPDELAAYEVEREDGTKVALGSFWADRPVALFFVRHFG